MAPVIGGIAAIQAELFYQKLNRPEWAPPGWLFGPVWMVLFSLMAASVYFIWQQRHLRPVKLALVSYGVQLVLNTLWTWMFFQWHCGGLAFAEVILLWLAIAWTMVEFWKIRRLAALLLVPYLLWVCYAMVLAWTVWRLNRQVL